MLVCFKKWIKFPVAFIVHWSELLISLSCDVTFLFTVIRESNKHQSKDFMRPRLTMTDSKQQQCKLRHMICRGRVKFLRDSGNYANKYGDVLADVMRRKSVLCPVKMTWVILTAANEWGARVWLEAEEWGVWGG